MQTQNRVTKYIVTDENLRIRKVYSGPIADAKAAHSREQLEIEKNNRLSKLTEVPLRSRTDRSIELEIKTLNEWLMNHQHEVHSIDFMTNEHRRNYLVREFIKRQENEISE